MALDLAARETKWLKQFLVELKFHHNTVPITIKGDNQGCISVANNDRTDRRTKHIDVQYHATRDKIKDGTICLEYCRTDQMIADSLTKPICKNKFIWCRSQMGVSDCSGDIDLGGNVKQNKPISSTVTLPSDGYGQLEAQPPVKGTLH